MTVKKNSPTFFRIISTDYLAQNFFVMIFAGWVIYGIDAVFKGNATFFLAIFASILTPIGLVTFFLRYNLIVSTFAQGIEVTGHVTTINTISTGKKTGDYIIYYQYDVNGRTHQYRNRVKKNAYAQKIRRGQRVNLITHEKRPQVAFIIEIYLGFT